MTHLLLPDQVNQFQTAGCHNLHYFLCLQSIIGLSSPVFFCFHAPDKHLILHNLKFDLYCKFCYGSELIFTQDNSQ